MLTHSISTQQSLSIVVTDTSQLQSHMTTLAQLNRPGGSGKQDAARTKIVIRRLPPALPEEIFWKSVGAWVSDDTASWKQYIAGRVGDE
jgi:hypothetical protein